MKISDDNIDSIKHTIEYGMFLYTLTVMVEFCVMHNKPIVLQTLNEFITTFKACLSEKEETEYQRLIDMVYKKKSEEFLQELHTSLTPKQIQQIISQLA